MLEIRNSVGDVSTAGIIDGLLLENIREKVDLMIVIGSAEGEETVQGSVGFGVGQLGSQYKIEEGL